MKFFCAVVILQLYLAAMNLKTSYVAAQDRNDFVTDCMRLKTQTPAECEVVWRETQPVSTTIPVHVGFFSTFWWR